MRIIKTAVLLLFFLFTFSGSAGRELEERVYPQALELDLRDGMLEGGFGEELVRGDSLAEICEEYQNRLSDYLDLGHIKAIVFGKALQSEKERMREVLLELEQMPLISRNSLVFVHEYQAGESYLKTLAQKEKNVGQYLCDLYRNNPYRAPQEKMTLARLLAG